MAKEAEFARMEVIHKHAVEANVTVHYQTDTQDTVKDRVGTAACNESSGGHWHKSGGQESLESPMIGSMGP